MAGARIGGFVSPQARERFLNACDAAMRAWPDPSEKIDLPTRFGDTRVYRHVGQSVTATPVVLLHGAAGTSAVWAPNVTAFARTRPVYAIDTIGDPGHSVQTAPILRPGDFAAWKAGVPNGHHLQNRGDRDAVYLEVGSRKPDEDACDYPDIDMITGPQGYHHRDGRPYPED